MAAACSLRVLQHSSPDRERTPVVETQHLLLLPFAYLDVNTQGDDRQRQPREHGHGAGLQPAAPQVQPLASREQDWHLRSRCTVSW